MARNPRRARRQQLVLVTPGDPDGIGPEIVAKVFHERGQSSIRSRFPGFSFVCVGAAAPFKKLRIPIFLITQDQIEKPSQDLLKEIHRVSASRIPLIAAPEKPPSKSIFLPGYQSGWSIETATRLIQGGKAEALVTGPISKERLQRGGFPFSGHTDFLASLCGVKQVTMMLANELLRVSLVTVHIGLKDVPQALTREKLRTAILHTVDELQRWWAIPKPRVAIAGLNPHAGEGGLFGDEESRVIEPELRALRVSARRRGYSLIGPLPADTLFAKHILAKPKERFDAVVCMYHDQGLIPVKLLDFPRTVNVTLGLPIVRTSVDHGVAFDIAGRGIADPSSLRSAIELAVKIIKNRRSRTTR